MFAIRVIYWLRSRRRTYYTPAWTLANQRFRKMCADFHRNRRQNTGTGDFVRSYIAFHHVSKEKRFIDFFFGFFFQGYFDDSKPLDLSVKSNVSATTRRAKPNKPYKLFCEVCAKGFDRPSLLKRHLRTHTGEANPIESIIT